MTVRLSPAQARAIGVDVPARPARMTRRTARGPYSTLCHTCGAAFTTQIAETRHVDDTHHARYDIPISKEPNS